jgi:hypothetical protein
VHHLTRLSLEYPKTAIAILLAITAFLGAGLPNVRSEYGYRVLVGDDYPSIQALDALIEQFGGGLPIQIGWECGEGSPCKHVFDSASLRVADEIARELARAEGVREVLGPANAPLLVPQAGGFVVRRFLEDGQLAEDIEELGQRALSDGSWNGTLVSRDGRVGVVVIQPADTRPSTGILVVDAIHEALKPYEARGFRFYIAGDAAEVYLSGRDLAESSTRLIPLTVLVIGSVLYLLCRSTSQTLVVLATMGATLLWTFGLLGWLDWPRDGILEVLAPLILIVGVCDSMHLLARIADLRNHESDGRESPESLGARKRRLREAARDVGGACTFTTLTDAGAFASFSTSALDSFVRFGLISAFGVIAALVLSFSLLPLLMCLVPHRQSAPRIQARWSTALEQIARLSRLRTRLILAVSGVALVTFGYCWAALLDVDTDWLESWGDRSELTRSIRFFEERVGDSKSVELRITLPTDTSIVDPDAIRIVKQLRDSLERVDGVSEATSVLSLIARVNRLLHDDDPRFERVPDTAPALAELLELISLDDESVLSPWISIDRSQIRISVKTRESTYRETQRFLTDVQETCARVLPAGWEVDTTGEIPTTIAWVRDIQGTQLRGFPTAILTVYLLIAAFLRSARLALAALLPTMLPIVITLGSMGLLGLNLDVGRAMIGSVVIGIGVDDAIHLLSQYQLHRRAGQTAHAAMAEALQHSGKAILTNSIALSLGFLTLMASAWQTISSFGFFVALAIFGALVSTLLVMPALIFAFSKEANA